LGPALMLLSWFDGGAGAIGRRLVEFGRVPLFFYLLQWPTVHLLAILVALANGDPVGWFFKDAPFKPPPGYGHGLGMVYLMWAVAVLLLCGLEGVHVRRLCLRGRPPQRRRKPFLLLLVEHHDVFVPPATFEQTR